METATKMLLPIYRAKGGLVPGCGEIPPERYLRPERGRGAPDFIIGFECAGNHPVERKGHQQSKRGEKIWRAGPLSRVSIRKR